MKPKRLISLLVAVCMVVVMLPVSAFAAGKGDEFAYTYSGVTLNYKVIDADKQFVELSHNENIKGDVVIPATVEDTNGTIYTVTEIGTDAINNGKSRWNNAPTSIKIPSTVTKINGSAFNNNWSLTKIEIPASVEYIGMWAFQWCGVVTEITFEEGSKLKKIDQSAFSCCQKVKEIVLPEGVETIGADAFGGCDDLESITIPSTVTTIETINNVPFVNDNGKVDIKYNGTNDLIFEGKVPGSLVNKIKHPHTVVFVMNGHGTAPADQIVYTGDPIEKVADPTAEGYTFGGWYADKDCTTLFDFNNAIFSDTTLYAKWVAIPATMNISVEKVTCAVGEPATIDFTINANGEAGKPATVSMEFSNESALEKLCVGVGDQWKDLPMKNSKIEIASLAAMSGQLEATFNKAGNYTLTVTMKTDAGTTVAKTINITVGEKAAEIVPATQLYDLTIKNADVTIKKGDEELKAEKNDKGELIAKVPENAEVTVTYTSQSDAVAFDQWTVTTDKDLDVDVKTNPLIFKMPAGGVTVEAMTKDASIEEEPNVLGTAAVIGTAAVGTAVLAWQGYELGTELYLKYALPAGAAIPTNRAELAELVWNNAGKPEPVAVLPAEATETEKAIAWAVENDLLKATKDNGEAYEETDSVSKLEVIKAWNKATSKQ